MKYNYATTRASARALRVSGQSVAEIAKALNIGPGTVKIMVADAAFPKAVALAAVARAKAAKKSAPKV